MSIVKLAFNTPCMCTKYADAELGANEKYKLAW
jgi:hypothetical protein